MSPTGNLAHNPGMFPDWESNHPPFGSQAGTQSTEPCQPGPESQFRILHHPALAHLSSLASWTKNEFYGNSSPSQGDLIMNSYLSHCEQNFVETHTFFFNLFFIAFSHLFMHSLSILICSLTRDQTPNLGIAGWCSNQLSNLAQAGNHLKQLLDLPLCGPDSTTGPRQGMELVHHRVCGSSQESLPHRSPWVCLSPTHSLSWGTLPSSFHGNLLFLSCLGYDIRTKVYILHHLFYSLRRWSPSSVFICEVWCHIENLKCIHRIFFYVTFLFLFFLTS